MTDIKRIYFVGIKGVGMAGLSIIAKEAGFTVSGSDISEEFLTDFILEKHKIPVDKGFGIEEIERFIGNAYGASLVITTAAHDGLSNPQVVWALEHHISVLTHGQAVGKFMDGRLLGRSFKGISILGCHGKTTVTAMTAIALKSLGIDASYTVGTSEIFPNGSAGHLGTSNYFVAEADEFVSDIKEDKTVKFLYQYPEFAIINNIDFDHPDVYTNLEHVKDTFLKFCIENIKPNGTLIINKDDENTSSILGKITDSRADITVITYGAAHDSKIQIKNYEENGWGSTFDVVHEGNEMGKYSLSVPGFYNAKNSLGVIALLLTLRVEVDDIKSAIAAFKGTKRRQEVVGETNKGAQVIDDYAHHPEEIDKTLTAIKRAYPNKRVIALFQPHTLSRTESLQHEFAMAFKNADEVIMLPIFTSKREGEVRYEALYQSIEREMKDTGASVVFLVDTRTHEELEFSPFFLDRNRAPVLKYIGEHFDLGSNVIVTLGAGDIYKIAYDIVDK